MIENKTILKEYLDYEYKLYFPEFKGKIYYYKERLFNSCTYNIWKYVKYLRIAEYYYLKRNGGFLYSLGWIFYNRKKNSLGIKLGIEITPCCFEKGLKIWHSEGIVVNGFARIGENCQLHGKNCIGNNGSDVKSAPIIGSNCDLGVGASIIGSIEIGNNITVGAGAVVTKSCADSNITLIGVPAKRKE